MTWFIIGLVLGALLVALVVAAKQKKLCIAWYQWVLGIVGVGVLLLMVQNIMGFSSELESAAITFTAIAMGIPGVVLVLLALVLPKLFRKKA